MPHAPQVSTMDGSFGCTGNVVEPRAQQIAGMKRPIQVFACGPEAMYRSLAALPRRRGHPLPGACGGEDGLRPGHLFRLREEDPR